MPVITKVLTQEIVDEALAKGEQILPLEIPHFWGSAVSIAFHTNDVNFTLSAPHAGTIASGFLLMTEPVLNFTVSVSTAKDIWLLLGQQLDAHEKKFGTIESDFSRTLKPTK